MLINDENYILHENENFSLIDFSGENVHETLTYVRTNHEKIDNSIRMFVAKIGDKIPNTDINNDTTLSMKDWEDDGQGHFKKDIIITNTPSDIDYNNGLGVNIIISPTENKGFNIINRIKEDSEETSRELYQDYSVRCVDHSYNPALNQITLSFMADNLPEYNMIINVLVLYNSKNAYSIPKDGEN